MAIQVEYAAHARCRPEHVWQVFENIKLWPRWDSDAIRDVRWVSGEPWTKGAKFSIEMAKPMSFKLTPEVLEAEPPVYVHLRGQGSGVTGEQHYIFRWLPEAESTELRTIQEFSGGPISFFGGKIKPAIEKGIAHLFARVIEEAEGRARAEVPPSQAEAPAAATGGVASVIDSPATVIPGLHAALHESLGIVLDHLATVPPELWTKELEGFGKPSVRDQLAHILSCEASWVRGLQQQPFEKPDVAALTTVDAFRKLQQEVKAATISYLDSLPGDELYAQLERYPERWIGLPRSPGFILLHAITHGFHHKGQVVAMFRLLGYPAPDTDMQRD